MRYVNVNARRKSIRCVFDIGGSPRARIITDIAAMLTLRPAFHLHLHTGIHTSAVTDGHHSTSTSPPPSPNLSHRKITPSHTPSEAEYIPWGCTQGHSRPTTAGDSERLSIRGDANLDVPDGQGA